MKRALLGIFALLLLSTGGCWRENMGSQPKAKTMQQSDFFADGATARPTVLGTVARGQANIDPQLDLGMLNGKPSESFPAHYPTANDGPFPTQGEPLKNILEHGRDEFTMYCSMCHGDAGDGRGIIVERGFVRPPDYGIDRLRITPPGHIFDVITNGYGAMYPYGDRIKPADRWAIVAYVRVLQMSRGAGVGTLDQDQVRKIGATP